MWKKLGFQIYKTEKGFKTYFRWQRDEAIRKLDHLEHATFSLDDEVTEVIDMEMIEDEINVRIDHPMTKKTILYLSLEYLSTKFNLLNYIQKVQRNVVLI